MSYEKKFLDQEGVEYLWSKISMEDYPNNETLIAILNAIDETKADKTEIPNDYVSYTEQSLTDEQKEQARINIGAEIATDEEIIDMLAQEDILPVVTDSDGAILSDENDNILLW